MVRFGDIKKSNMNPEKHSKNWIKIDSSVRRTAGKSLSDNEGSSTDPDEVIVWCGNKDLTEVVQATSGCSGSLDGWVDVKYSTGEVNDWGSSSYSSVGELQRSSEAETELKQQTRRVPKKIQKTTDKVIDKNKQSVGGDKGIVGGALNREEVTQTGVSNKIQQMQSANSEAGNDKSGRKHDKEKPNIRGPLDGSVGVSGRNIEQQRERKEIHDSRKVNAELPCGSLPDIHGVSPCSNHSSERAKESSHIKTVALDVPTNSRDISKQQLEIGNMIGIAQNASCKGKTKMQWRAKNSSMAVGNISTGVDICSVSEDPHPKRTYASKEITESLNHRKENLGNAKESESEVNVSSPIFGSGSCGEWEVALQNSKFGETDSEEVAEEGTFEPGTFCPDLSVNAKDVLPLKYVPLKQLQNLQESEIRKGCGIKCEFSKQHPYAACNKSPQNKERASNKNGQRQVGDKKMGNVVLENGMRQMGSSGTEDGDLDKNKQSQRGKYGVTSGQPSVKGPSFGSLKMGREKMEYDGVEKKLEVSGQGGKNKQSELPIVGSSTLEGATGRPNQGGSSVEDEKIVGDKGNGIHSFFGWGNDVEGGVILNHIEKQVFPISVVKEGGIDVLEFSRQGGKNKQSEHPIVGSSALEGATGTPNQGGPSVENAKNYGDKVNVRHSFPGCENDVDGDVTLNHIENQVLAITAVKEEGIDISLPFPLENGRPQSFKKGGRHMTTITITNKGKKSQKLCAVELDKVRPKNSFSLSQSAESVNHIEAEDKSCIYSIGYLEVKMKPMNIPQLGTQSTSLIEGPWLIKPMHDYTIHLSCHAKDIGLQRSSILFNFLDQKIVLQATLLAEDDISEQLAPQEPYSKFQKRKPYSKFQKRKSVSFRKIVGGVPPPLPSFRRRLKSYPIPVRLQNIADKKLPRILTDGLSIKTYSKYFSTLLHLEELQMLEDITAYDMQNVTIRSSSEYLVLKVPGLSEKRPSLIYRDKISITKSGGKGTAYEGYIYKIEANEIFVKFNKSFHKKFIPGLQYDVSFSFSRTSLRRCHQAVEAAGRIYEEFLFPWDPLARKLHNNVSKIDPINSNLNKEQLSAVHEILNCYGSPPYLVYGPPGTGKTATLIEAILQILKSNSKACILACAPSNGASDILVERLLGSVEKREIFRLNALSRPYQDVSPHILPYCCFRDSTFQCPPMEELFKFKIVASTYLSAAILDAQEVPRGHFTHILLDEAAQGTEPETMVPIANFANERTTVVLAGDPQQLGPIIRSSISEKMGLGKSYFERLSELRLYSSCGENKQFITKLVRNYRSHPAILELPSRLFYGNELIACAGKGIKKLHCAFDELSNKKFPVIFVGIEGVDEREGRSPSWFNTIEISKVLDIVKKVKDDKRNSVTGKDIGVITPYHQQVVKLRKAFGQNYLSDVKVGSVEQFQGDERTVIIISTVRSSYKNEDYDMKFNLGFIGNPKRFNVAITRAKSLLVVVGNPYVLSKDMYWNELLEYCVSNKSYVGCALPPKNNRNDFPPGTFSSDVDTSGPMSSISANQDMEWADGTC